MATIGEIQQVAAYQGSNELGGGNIGVAPALDLQPLQRLADFTYLKNKQNYLEQKQQFDAAVTQAATDLSVDWSKIIPKHREDLFTEREALKQFAREHPDSWSQNSKYFGELQDKKNQFKENITGALGRGIEFEVGKKFIAEKALSGADVSSLQSELDGKVGGIHDKIDVFAEFQGTPVDLKAGTMSNTKSFAMPNFIRKEKQVITDMGQVDAIGSQLQLDELARVGSVNKTFDDMAKQGTAILQSYIADPKNALHNADGSYAGLTPFAKGDNSGPGQLARQVEEYNQEIRQFNSLDPANQVAEINPADGLNQQEMGKLVAYGKTKEAKRNLLKETTLDYTGQDNSLQIARERNASAERRQRARLAAMKPADQEGALNEMYVRNFSQQPLVAALVGGIFTSQLGVNSSLPVLTLKNGKITNLEPIGATPIYPTGDDGEPDKTKKPIGYEGGAYNIKYTNANGQALDAYQMKKGFEIYQKSNPGKDVNDMVKELVSNGKLNYVIQGANGQVDRQLWYDIQRALSNKETKKGQTEVFSEEVEE